ncbi:MAG: hypothetical protein PF689_02690 [Deltaproteobacteria bacterium]|jgi:hypothetical protein|nr:hypothetical protein [Deltaproteobacteria bacterium]
MNLKSHFYLLFSVLLSFYFVSLLNCAGSGGDSNNNVELCDNGTDDDGDTLVDCEDADCYSAQACQNLEDEICNNGIDDDGDSAIDCDDADCVNHNNCKDDPEICDNNIDDDDDDSVDCDDADCVDDPACEDETPEICTNDIDDDSDGDIDCDDSECNGSIYCETEEICDNDMDDDGDGLVDCEDSECSSDAACVSNCSVDYLYYDTATSCPTGEECGLYIDTNDDIQVDCLSDSNFSGGSFYGACGTSNECPFGSVCNSSVCMPFCDIENDPPQHTCPTTNGGGVCLYVVETVNLNEVGLCKGIDNCDIVSNSCSVGICRMTTSGTICLEGSNNYTEGQTCEFLDDCAEGLICVGTCESACYLGSGTGCTTGQTCVELVDPDDNPLPDYGVCIVQK